MAVSVPKVLVRPPGERQYEWMDLWESYVSGRVAALGDGP
jgi:ATP-dependent Clp protease protease subunit